MRIIITGLLLLAFYITNAQTAPYYLDAGIELLRGGNYQASVITFSKGIKKADKESESLTLAKLYFNRGLAFEMLHKPDDALNDINMAITLKPSHFDFYKMRYSILTEKKEYRKAMVDVDSMLKIKPNDLAVLKRKVSVYIHLKEFDNARRTCRQIISINPNDAEEYQLLVWAYQWQRKYDSALLIMDTAIMLEPSNASNYNARGCIYGEQKNYAACEKDNLKCMDLDSKMTAMSYNNIVYYIDLAQKQWQKAIDDANKGLASDKEEVYLYANRGYAEIMLNKMEEGRKDIELALEKDPNDAYAVYYLAVYYKMQGKKSKCCELLNKALKMDMDIDINDLCSAALKENGCN
jgi:tetratricopeptide (TPR) repeat protein